MCLVKRGVRVVRKDLKEGGVYNVYQNSLIPLGRHSVYNTPENTTFVIIGGAAGNIGYSDKKFWAADDCLSILSSEYVSSRYVFHYLMSRQNYIKSRVRKAGVPRLSRSIIDNMVIPVPQIEEQERIVTILDRFEKLTNDITEGLPAEIKARQQQYEYYRNKLLTFKQKLSA